MEEENNLINSESQVFFSHQEVKSNIFRETFSLIIIFLIIFLTIFYYFKFENQFISNKSIKGISKIQKDGIYYFFSTIPRSPDFIHSWSLYLNISLFNNSLNYYY